MTKEEAISINARFLSFKIDKKESDLTSWPGNEYLWENCVCGICDMKFLEYEKFLNFTPPSLQNSLLNNGSQKIHFSHVPEKDKDTYYDVACVAKKKIWASEWGDFYY